MTLDGTLNQTPANNSAAHNPQAWPAPPAQSAPTASAKKTSRQVAALVIGGGGGAVILSTILPWVATMGGFSGRLGGGAIVTLLILGGALVGLASLVYRSRSLSTARVFLWVLAVVDIVVVLAFFAALKVDGAISGVVSPGIGFYLALLGLLATIGGTIAQQIAKPAAAVHIAATQTMNPAALPQSDDGNYWWNGTAWVAYR